MFTSCTRRLFAVLALLGLAAGSFVGAQPSVVAPPQGYITWTLQTGTTEIFGVPLSDTPDTQGLISSVTADSIQVAGAPWTEGQFSGSLHILSGDQEGRCLPILSNTSNSLTLAVENRPLTETGFAVAAGDRFEILPRETLGTLFGNTQAEVQLQSGATAPAADIAALFLDGQWVEFFFRTDQGWRRVDQPDTPAALPSILPTHPIRIARRGPTQDIVFTGRVPVTKALLPVTATTTPLAWPFPVSVPLSGLILGGPDLWKQAAVAGDADWISLPANGGTFFQRSDESWSAAPQSSVTNLANAQFLVGGGFYIAKHASSPTGLHAVELPYDPSGPSLPEPTPTPTPRPNSPGQAASFPPLLRVARTSSKTSSSRVILRGSATARGTPVVRVEFKSGSKFKKASGTAKWSARVPLKMGRNIISVRAVDNLGRTSSLKKVTITRTN